MVIEYLIDDSPLKQKDENIWQYLSKSKKCKSKNSTFDNQSKMRVSDHRMPNSDIEVP